MNKKKNILLSISLLATAVTITTIAAIAAKGKFKKQQELKQNIEKYKAELNKAKSILEKLLKSDNAKNVNKLEESKILDNAKLNENSTLDEIKKAIKELQEAKAALELKISKAREKAKQEFDTKKEQLKTLIGSRDAKSVDNKKESDVLRDNLIDSNTLIKEIKTKTEKITEAINSLTTSIKNKKDDEFNKYNAIKTSLENLVKEDDAVQVGIADVQKTLSENNVDKTATIEKIQHSTEVLTRAKEELQKLIDNTKKQLANEFKTEKIKLQTLSFSLDATYVDKNDELIILNNTNITNSDSIKQIKEKMARIQNASKSLTNKISKQKERELEKYNIAKTALEQLIKDEDAKEVDTTEATTALTKTKADKNSTLDEIINATKVLDKAKSKLDQEIKAKKQGLMANLKAKNKKLDALLSTENLYELSHTYFKVLIGDEKVRNTLDEAYWLLQEAKKLPENSKIANINQKIQKIDEFVGKIELWIRVMKDKKEDIVNHIKLRIKNLKQIKSNKIYSVFLEKLKNVLEKPIFNNLSWTTILSTLEKACEDSDNLWKLCQLYSEYKDDTNLSSALQEKLAKEFKNILYEEVIPTDYQITELEKKLKKIVEEDLKMQFCSQQKEAKQKNKEIKEVLPSLVKELYEFKKVCLWMDGALRMIEEEYNLALQYNDLNNLKTETRKIKNLNKLINSFFSYIVRSYRLISGPYIPEVVLERAIKKASQALNDMASINLDQEIGNDKLMNKRVNDINDEFNKAFTRL